MMERTVLMIEEQTELSIESEFTKQELEFSDVLGKRSRLEESPTESIQIDSGIQSLLHLCRLRLIRMSNY